MSEEKSPSSINQTAIGNENIQVVGSHNVITRITNFFAGDTEQQRAQRNRRAMLELVKNTWIKGVLEKSLYREVVIELGMEERPGAVDHPWDMQVQMPDQINRTLPSGTSIMEVFDEMHGAMLILGEPGAGKTTMLLELARDCITRAEQDDHQPIPVVFNLSSWADRKQSIDDWLVNELNSKYNASKKIARSWVDNDELLLLLDGLDEVRLEYREACVNAINDFRQKHGLTMSIAVCSRIANYEALTVRLSLRGAALLLPLTSEQIEEYFEQVGSQLEGVYQVLQHDMTLQELVKQPLMLSILTLAYRGVPAQAFASEITGTLEMQGKRPEIRTIEITRKQLFDTYIEQMFKRVARTKSELYPPERTKDWLGWLAQKMIRYNAVPYLVENMQPKWLDLKWGYRLTLGLSFGLLVGLGLWLVLALLGDWISGLFFGPTIGLTVGLSALLLLGRKDIEMVDALTWKPTAGLFYGVGIILFLGLIFGLLGLIFGGINFAVSGLLVGLGLGLIFGPGFIVLRGLRPKQVERTTYPGERISFSIKNFLIAVPLIGLSFGLGFGLAFGFLLGSEIGLGWFHSLYLGLLAGLVIGLIFGLGFGGFAVIQHYTLRYLLGLNDFLPFRLVPFLDYCADRIFLRRVGGGYIFIHRLLMEHFAAMYSEDEKAR